ncbi:putative fibulin-1-like [Scomber scombrus]|uniref:Fibulin-1-like n=1 Tax=Scomber scombrus TaxID=13677 RepID=A0AAV1MWK6_SCOSC
MEGGQRDLSVTPLTDLHVDPKPSSGENVCNYCDAENHIFELPFAPNASVFLLRLKETSRRKRFAPLQGLECGEEIIRTLRETRPLFTGVCDSTHQCSIN